MGWSRFGSAVSDDDQPIEAWMDDQNDQVAQREALASAGRDRWSASTRSGEYLDAGRPADVVALGNGPVNAPRFRRDAASKAALRAQRVDDAQFQSRFDGGQNMWTGNPVAADLPMPMPRPVPRRAPSQAQPWWETAAKFGAGAGAYAGGTVLGALIAVGDAARDLWDAGYFGLKWAGAFGPPAKAQAQREAAEAARGAVDYARSAIAQPSRAVSDARTAAGHALDNMSPFNVNLSGSLSDVAHHQFEHGLNFGEAATNVAGMFAGGEAVQGLRAAKMFEATKPARVAKLIEEGANPRLSEYMSQPYKGSSHHSIISKRQAKDAGLPAWLVDSRLNLAEPRGMSRSDFYKYHYQVDPKAGGFRLPADLNGGKGWRPKELGLIKYGLPERIWKGMPVPLKDAMAAVPFVDAPRFYDKLETTQ